MAELAGYAVHQLRVYRLQKIESGDDGNPPIIMLRRGQIVVPLPAPRRLLVRREAVDVANGDGLARTLDELRASILATLKERNKGPPDPDDEGGKGGKGVEWHRGVALDFEDETAATKAAHRLRARVLSPDCRILREKLKGGDVATRVTLVGVPLTISTIDDILGSGDDVYVYTASSFNELAVDFASPAMLCLTNCWGAPTYQRAQEATQEGALVGGANPPRDPLSDGENTE